MDREVLPLVVSLILIMAGLSVLFVGLGYSSINPVVVLAFTYTIVITFIVEKKLTVPRAITRLYDNELFDKLAVLFYIPSALLFFEVGYSYGPAIVLTEYLSEVVGSAILGVSVGFGLLIVSILYERRGEQGA